ncbi:F-box only protein 6-like isoform X2 [Gouania willdenowi]|uniref:F-box only protein 6-like n=1 Tax=Gouania willdenowi TaxID=441366 RepID=A0A8C5FZ54_GOUWI|nr:F-box only protein 6-like isoform X2 [Gouania willdenowi]
MGVALSCKSASGRTQSDTGEPPALLFDQHILEEIFLKLPYTQVVRVCRLVCHQWKEVADSQSLWKEKCRRDGYKLCDTTKIPTDWRLFYALCHNKQNLLKNSCGEDQLKGWQMLDKGQKWQVKKLWEPHPNEKVRTNFVTSYGRCRKMQLIDLKKKGYSSSFMDEFQPAIRVTDWYAALWDCAIEYTIFVKLLNQKKEVINEFCPEPFYFEPRFDLQWNQVTHIFRNYGPGVRYVIIVHGGSVRRFWSEWCGIRITDTCIEICPAEAT